MRVRMSDVEGLLAPIPTTAGAAWARAQAPVRLFVEDDADDTPTIWVHDPARPDAPFALLRRFDLESQLCIARHDHRDAVREAIDAVWQRLTAGLPTSAPAVTP